MVGALAAIFMVPMFILNSLAGLVGGVWLLWLGDWKLVLVGFLAAACAPLWTSILLLPGLVFAGPGIAAIERGYTVTGIALASLSGLWTYIVVTIWCIAAFWYVPHYWTHGQPIVPFLLFAYSVATSPWAIMAQKESQGGGGEAAQFTLSAACVGCALILGYVLLAARPSFSTALWFLIVPMAATYLLSVFIAIVGSRRRVQHGY
jgi:hypothetical protein